MNVVISIVSHGHQAMLQENELVASPNQFRVIVRENIPESERLMPGNIDYIQNLRRSGFGANHNKTFEMARMDVDDWFVICNPDIIVSANQVSDLLLRADSDGAELVAPMLWNNHTNEFDHNVRPRVRLFGLALSFVGVSGPSRYSEELLVTLETADWASGAFLAIKAGLFRNLGGFDERYFMYMEDVDLCRRAKSACISLNFYNDIRMIHNAARDNRKILSRHFAYHLRSVWRYFFF